jgi:probable HAF family extracellular repeat protein
MIDLGTFLGGGDYSVGRGVNALGQVTGEARTPGAEHAFMYSNGTMIDLGTLGGNSSGGTGINILGQVIGWAETSGNAATHPFLYSHGVTADLSTPH